MKMLIILIMKIVKSDKPVYVKKFIQLIDLLVLYEKN